MLLGLLLTLNIIVCIALVAVVLLQRSDGGDTTRPKFESGGVRASNRC